MHGREKKREKKGENREKKREKKGEKGKTKKKENGGGLVNAWEEGRKQGKKTEVG